MPLFYTPPSTPGTSKTGGKPTENKDHRESHADDMATLPPPLRTNVAYPEAHASDFRNVRLLIFWKNRPALYFVQLKSEFTAYRIRSDDVRYSAIIRHLDEQTMIAVSDILETLAQDKYTHLKLGDRKPFNLLRKMKILACSSVSENLLHTLWLQRLPIRIQELLIIFDKADLEKLAECADKA